MILEERIAIIEAELNQAAQQVNVWRERQLMAQGALNILRQIASEKNEEINTSDPDTAPDSVGAGG